MTEKTLGDATAGNDATKVEGAGNPSEKVEISKEEFEKLKGKADKYHEFAWKYFKLKDEVDGKLKKVEEPSDDDDETTKFNKAVRKAVQEEISDKTNYELREKEEKAFLEVNPDAYLKLEEIRSLKQKNPELSYNKIYKFFFEEEAQPVKTSIKWTSPKVSDDGDMSRESINDAFKKMMGR